MIVALKIVILLVLLLLFAYPLLPLPSKMRRFSTFYSLRYHTPFNKRNFVFVLITLAEFIVVAFLFELLTMLTDAVSAIPFVAKLVESIHAKVGSTVEFSAFVIRIVLINIAILYVFVFLKGFLKRLLIDPVFGWGKYGRLSRKERKKLMRERRLARKKKKEEKKWAKKERAALKKAKRKKSDQTKTDEKDPEKTGEDEENKHVLPFPHLDGEEPDKKDPKGKDKEKEDEENHPEPAEEPLPLPPRTVFGQRLLGLFFEAPEYLYARPGVARATTVLQGFIYGAEILYLLLFAALLATVLFPLPAALSSLAIRLLRGGNLYVYPFISLIFLQEVCNFFHTDRPLPKTPEILEEEEISEQSKQCEARLSALNDELKKRFDEEHCLRYYPDLPGKKVPEYVCSSVTYASALEYIRSYAQQSSGHVVQSYIESLDAAFNDHHIYFGTSFYSEYGEYLTAYTYTRLLSGARMIFITSDGEKAESLRTYVRDRLTKMTGSSDACTWRVYLRGERLDQADVLIATPEDFQDDSLINHYPAFFEEVCSAVFVDAERVTSMYSYLCPILSIRLQKATDGRIRFIFLTKDVLRGFAAKTLPRYFCVDQVFSCSNALENECTSYTLLNRESKSHRIYNKHGQALTSLECILANQARRFGVDGVKIISKAPMEHADQITLLSHGVEINEFHKPVPTINYMIFADENCNLASAIYTCTRFRGRVRSVANIISKPYLLRDYFVFMAGNGDYINRSSFIQPRAVEYMDARKLSLLRVFCEASMGNGIPVSSFAAKMQSIIDTASNRFAEPLCPFCEWMFERIRSEKTVTTEADLAAYLVAGLLDDRDTPVDHSAGNRAKDYYLITDPKYAATAMVRDKWISFKRSKEFFDRMTACNRRVELRLNDETVGFLDTFPNRVSQQYMVGQSLIFRNVEYEIGQISDDRRVIYLRNENVTFRNSLDTFFLRRYTVSDPKPVGDEGVLYLSNSELKEIRVSRVKADVIGESYGFLTLTADNQTLDFVHGVEGNPMLAEKIIRENRRELSGSVCLMVTLQARMECNDRMRLLLSLVFNEFIKTIFPKAYRMIAVCPVLKEPITEPWSADGTNENQIRALYPYLADQCITEDDDHRLRFFFINDCEEDIGVLDWFYDGKAHYMQEFLSHVYSYLQWLSKCGKPGVYIYFGDEKLSDCFDADGCRRLLKNFGLRLSDDGAEDYDTADHFEALVNPHRCAFCHRVVESGRYALFDHNRYICVDCFGVVREEEQLKQLLKDTYSYLHKTYPEVVFPPMTAEFDKVYDLTEEEVFSENYYRLDYDKRTVYVEKDSPETNVRVSLLRALISLWQSDNELLIPYANGQLYFEELLYLKKAGKEESALWIHDALKKELRAEVDEIEGYVHFRDGDSEQEDPETDGNEYEADGNEDGADGNESSPDNENAERRTSFGFLMRQAQLLKEEDNGDDGVGDGAYSNGLYDPNKIPRFWKSYLRGVRATEQEDLLSDDDRDQLDDDSLAELENDGDESGSFDAKENMKNEPNAPNSGINWEERILPNAPPPGLDDGDETGDETEDEAEEEAEGETEGEAEPGKKTRKKLSFGNLFKRKKKDPKGGEEPKDEDPKDEEPKDEEPKDDEPKDEEPKGGEEPKGDEEPKGKTKDPRKKPRDKTRLTPEQKKHARLKKKIYDEEEAKNPKIRLYNEMVRHAFAYDASPISRQGISDDDVARIFHYVTDDWPELFWVQGYSWNSQTTSLRFRCLDENGEIDVAQIKRKRRQLAQAAKEFTRGITRRTKPIDACLTIYRRLILTLDYDSIGLNSGAGKDLKSDDNLRSLYGALVEHKVVCAGYAVAMQYLMQSVGISCACVTSEDDASGTSCHAFNALRLGKYCYYLDATWGDNSKTQTGEADRGRIYYDYFCVPYREFVQTGSGDRALHEPRKKYYPDLEEFTATRHEYFRRNDAYFTRYDEEKLIDLMVRTATQYDPKEMGDFCICFRCADESLRDYIVGNLQKDGKLYDLLHRAQARLGKKKKARALLDWKGYSWVSQKGTSTAYYFPLQKDGKK